METVEMDLMQAQIGSLATDVSRLERKVATSKSEGIIVTFSDVTVTPTSPPQIFANASMLAPEIAEYLEKGVPVYAMLDGTPMGSTNTYMIPINTLHYSGGELDNVQSQFPLYQSGALAGELNLVIEEKAGGSPEHSATVTIYLNS